MHNFCTLFDSYYLSRGVATYESLRRHCPEFHLYIFAFDDLSKDYLLKQNFPSVTVISLAEFENPQLLKVKPGRNKAEYCWTCTPQVIKFAMDTYSLPSCTYLDADIYFFADPGQLIDEVGERSVLITEHRYTPEYDQSATSGIYCVQFMTFRGTEEGMRVLNWWLEACLEWCFARYEDGRFGDQKYLDDWPRRFAGMHELRHLGGGVAPWNVQQYDFTSADRSGILATERSSAKDFGVVFYHFQNFKFVGSTHVELGYYKLSNAAKKLIYKPYLANLLKIESVIRSDAEFTACINSVSPIKMDIFWFLKLLRRRVLGYMNFHAIEKLLRY